MPLYPSAAVDAEAAAVYTGVDRGTLRQWRHRGLIEPCGGTPRRPLYLVDDLERVLKTRQAQAI